MERIPKINEAFELFESVINDAIDSSTPDDILIRSYFSIVEILIKSTCTGKYATKFSEFFYVRYVKKYLETHLEKFDFTEEAIKGRSSPRFAALYKGKKVILSSDIPIQSAGISESPDIFVGIEKENGIIHPIAIFEIKLHQDKSQLATLIKRFLKMRDDFANKFSGDELPYFVWLYLRYEKYLKQDYEEEIAQFKSLSKNNLIVVNEITEWTINSYKSNIKGGINSILKKIVRKIEIF
ncbi:unnamed protein product [marine sediment metagenome]|uniref:Restriction endonuclease n=1 Tax=marine sediment metagenome TaxID=412755 RepID=X1FXQ4_9ZZZZ